MRPGVGSNRRGTFYERILSNREKKVTMILHIRRVVS